MLGATMSKLIDLTGKRFGKLTVLSRAENSKANTAKWLCRCDCGNTCIVYGSSLRRGQTQSCGCLRGDRNMERSTHGMRKTRLYGVWNNMRRRCYEPTTKSFKDYGGRGIKVCDEWLEPEAFFDWAKASGYAEGLTIERIDVNGNYEPSNCKWITKAEQARNKTNSFMVEIDGESKCLHQWCDEMGIDYHLVYARMKRLGWDAKKALTTPPRKLQKRR